MSPAIGALLLALLLLLGTSMAALELNAAEAAQQYLSSLEWEQADDHTISRDSGRLLMEDEAVAPVLAHGWSDYSLSVVRAAAAEAGGYGEYADVGYGGYYAGGYGSGVYGYGGYASAYAAQAETAAAAAVAPATAAARPASRSLIAAQPAAAVTAATPAARTTATTAACRYDALLAAWALEEPDCRATLQRRCSAADALLDCADVDAFYAAVGTGSGAVAAAEALAAFLFVDSPPAPPCSCQAAVLEGSDAPASRSACCSDLRAHCQVPFSGLGCEAVAIFCSSLAGEHSRSTALVARFVRVKTHAQDCSRPQLAAAYEAGATGAITGTQLEARAAALTLELDAAAGRAPGITRWAAGMTLGATLAGCSMAVTAAVIGMSALVRHLQQVRYAPHTVGDLYS